MRPVVRELSIVRLVRYSFTMTKGRAATAQSASKAAGEGGSRAAAGFGFQANATAYIVAHLLTGQSLGGLSCLLDSVPLAVSAESGGAGDDLHIELVDGRIIEAQVKRGLRRGPRLWDTLEVLAAGIHRSEADFGLLIVCPQSSSTILGHLAKDLVRLGDGRTDQLSEIGAAWRTRLAAAGLPITICSRIRIVALSITDNQSEDIRTAQAHLRTIIADPGEATRAWKWLADDGDHMIEYRGRRTLATAMRVLTSHGIALRTSDTPNVPALLLGKLLTWTVETNANYEIIGIGAPLAIDKGWIAQFARVLADPGSSPDSFTEALQRYRNNRSNVDESSQEHLRNVHGATIGRFLSRCVVLAGPGMGKTTLLTKLARTYAADGYPVLKVRLRALAERMRAMRETFEEALFALGLDKSGIAPAAARTCDFRHWVILLDGLDECGTGRGEMARDLVAFGTAHPGCRIVVTSRSIGYEPRALSTWRHYSLTPLAEDHLFASVGRLIAAIEPDGAPDRARVDAIVTILKASPAVATFASNPLLLGLATALAYKNGSIGRTETDLYQRIFALMEAAASERASKAGLTDAELSRTIDIIGHSLIANPAETETQTLDRATALLTEELGCQPLAARRNCELAIRYWCDVGLLEQIHHRGVEMLAFVHKTFGEFASARFIRAADPRQRPALLRQAVMLQADPVIDFAAALGLGKDAFRVLLDVKSPFSAEMVVRGLSLAVYASANDVAEVLEDLVERAFELLETVTSDDWPKQIGAALRALSAAHRDMLIPLARAYLDSGTANSRLAAWGVLLESGLDDSMGARLLDLIEAITTSDKTAEPAPYLAASSLLQTFAIGASDCLLAARDPESDAALTGLLRQPGLNSAGFVLRIEPILERHGRRDIQAAMREHWYGKRNRSYSNIDLQGYEKAAAASEIAQLTALSGDAAPDPGLIAGSGTILPNLSAFAQMTRWGETPGNDVWQWTKENWRPVEYAVLRAAARAGIVDPEQLAVEAASLLAIRDSIKSYHTFAMFACTAPIDIPEVDWSNVAAHAPDVARLEQALHHGSHYLVPIAVNILDELLLEDDRRGIVTRTLAEGRGLALWAAASLAGKLPAAEAVELVLSRVEADPGYGAEYLLGIFQYHPILPGERLEAALRIAFRSDRPEVAQAAAKAVHGLHKAGATLQRMLFEALDYWTANPPGPRKIGQPPNPRGAIADALAAIGELGDAELIDLLRYREDFGSRQAVRNLSKQRWVERSSFRDAVFEATERGDLAAHELRKLIGHSVTLTPGQRSAALRLAGAESAAIRRVLVDLFGWPGFLDEISAPMLDLLVEDPEPEIREAAGVIATARHALA